MDWTGCDLVERVDGRCSGAPTVLGTRIFPNTFIDGADYGMSVEEVHEDFPTVSVGTIIGLLAFAKQHTLKQST